MNDTIGTYLLIGAMVASLLLPLLLNRQKCLIEKGSYAIVQRRNKILYVIEGPAAFALPFFAKMECIEKEVYCGADFFLHASSDAEHDPLLKVLISVLMTVQDPLAFLQHGGDADLFFETSVTEIIDGTTIWDWYATPDSACGNVHTQLPESLARYGLSINEIRCTLYVRDAQDELHAPAHEEWHVMFDV